MKLNPTEEKYKSILTDGDEICKLSRLTWNAPIVPVDKPYHLGYVKYLELRPDIQRRPDADRFKHILRVLGRNVYCRTLEFKNYKGDELKCYFRNVGMGEWGNIGFPEYYKKYFYQGIVHLGDYPYFSKGQGYEFLYKHFYVEKFKPYYVTHQRMVIPEVQRRKKELENKFESKNFWPKYDKIKRGKCYKYKNKKSLIDLKAPTLEDELIHMELIYGLDWFNSNNDYDDNARYIDYNNRYFTVEEYIQHNSKELENRIPL